MNIKNKKVRTRFAPETRFELSPVPAAPFRGTQEVELDRLKDRLLRTALDTTDNPALYAPLRRAANDAAALAWLTPYPQLVLPVLFDEKVHTAREQTERQARIRFRSRGLMEAAA